MNIIFETGVLLSTANDQTRLLSERESDVPEHERTPIIEN